MGKVRVVYNLTLILSSYVSKSHLLTHLIVYVHAYVGMYIFVFGGAMVSFVCLFTWGEFLYAPGTYVLVVVRINAM